MATSNELWAEKYQPRAFLELLTESEHSKVMMAWLELWDQHVFKRTKNYEIGLNDYYKSMLETEEAMPYLPKKKVCYSIPDFKLIFIFSFCFCTDRLDVQRVHWRRFAPFKQAIDRLSLMQGKLCTMIEIA